MNRKSLYIAFVEKWTHPEYRPVPQSEHSLNAAEEELGVKFPASYREYMMDHGAGGPTSQLLDAIVEHELDIHDLGEIYSVDSIVETADGMKRAGLPDGFVAIAADSLGNKFCFSVEECGRTTLKDAPVWLFDRESGTIDRIANGFEEWIDDCLRIPKDAPH